MEMNVLGCTYRPIDYKCTDFCQSETKLDIVFAPTLPYIDTFLNRLNVQNEKANCITACFSAVKERHSE